MVAQFRCEICGGGEFSVLRKEIYEKNGGGYHDSVSFKGNRRVFRCSECGKVWWCDPVSEFINILTAESIHSGIKVPASALKTG